MMMIMVIKLTSIPWIYSHDDDDDDNKIDFYTLDSKKKKKKKKNHIFQLFFLRKWFGVYS